MPILYVSPLALETDLNNSRSLLEREDVVIYLSDMKLRNFVYLVRDWEPVFPAKVTLRKFAALEDDGRFLLMPTECNFRYHPDPHVEEHYNVFNLALSALRKLGACVPDFDPELHAACSKAYWNWIDMAYFLRGSGVTVRR